MKQILLCLLYWSYIRPSASFPVEEKPGFTLWPLEKRGVEPLTELQYSGVRGTQLGISVASHFGIPDPTCRGKMPGDGCWTMDQFSVDKMLEAREPKANNCPVPCLFYTQKLSGAAERTANFVLWDALLMGATEGKRNFQTIWDLHSPKYYPEKNNLDATPEVKCAYLDAEDDDQETHFNGCQRRYFMSMSKAMAAECSGEVFLLTMTKLNIGKDVPEDGIWWEVEFPTLIDPSRAEDKKVTKITYIQVRDLTPEQFKVLQDLPDEERAPPEILHQGEYWPTGHGKTQLEKPKFPLSRLEVLPLEPSPPTTAFVKRADRSDAGICAHGDDCYPYPYPIKDMYEWYKDATW